MGSRWSARIAKSCGALFLLLLGWGETPCGGQENSSDLSNLSLEELGEIEVYSASKHMQASREAPSSVTVITANDIKQHGYRTLADILKSVRGFYITSDRNYSYIGVRGFSRPGDYNTRVLLLVDGHRINDNIYDQAMLGTEFPLDVDMIERVEVVRGPVSSLYGSNAFFATLNVITRKKSQVNGWELSFEPGSFATYKGRASYGGTLKGADVVLSASFYDSGGQTLFFPEYNSPGTNHGVARNADYDRYRDLLLTIDFRHFTFQAVDGWREKGIPTAPYGVEFGATRTRSVDHHQYLDLRHKNSFGGWELDARTYYDRAGYDGYWIYSPMTNFDYTRGQKWGAEIQLSHIFAKKHHLTFGGESRANLQQDQKNYDVAPVTIYVNDRRDSWMGAGFIQDEYAITPRLTLNAGVRYDRYTRYGGSSNPRFALIYRPFESTSFKLLYGSAFRAPNVYEAYYGTDNPGNSDYIFNPRLGPESMRNVEGIWEQKAGAHLQISTAVFRSRILDLITLQQDPASGELVFRNSDEARSTGVEFEAQGRLPHELKAALSYTFTEAEDERTNQILVNSPRHMVKFDLTAPLYKQFLLAGIDAQYVDARRTLAGNRAPAFPVFNLTLLGHLNQHLELSGSVYNLLQRHAFDVGPPEDKQDVLQQDGRNFRVTLTYRWGGKR